ncbi:MAG: uroporphyrinogen decarboxylase family protein [Thermovenabulum sp.]|uniref:uroporphyrinogen decarboxylase family protein n=1 Tax=Thermovenabulum sp. TaxID=3100335 RepID=UPI003C7BD894
MEDMERLSMERTQLFRDVYDGKIPKRVPIATAVDIAYAIQYAGYDLKEAQWNLYLLKDVIDKAARDFKSDGVPTVFLRIPLMYQILGAKNFVMSSEGFMQHPEVSAMEAEEYDELIKDPYKFIIEKVLPRLYKNLDTTPEKRSIVFAKAYKVFYDSMMQVGIYSAEAARKYGLSMEGLGTLIEAPFDFIADQMRGFTNIVKDIRRIPEKVAEACEAILPLMLKAGLAPEPSSYKRAFIPLHMPPYLRTSDFEKVFWPTFKKLVDGLVEKGMGVDLFLEQDWMRYIDYLAELPKGVKMWFEYGDPKLIKERLGKKHIITGLYPISLLRTGNKKECIDKAKELVDILAPGGGYIFNFDKSPLVLNDAKPENIIAVNEFVRENAVYK